ncbi:MAG: ABC transporter permease [Erysipelothrix sp.]|nr:ABC transporter permease [Erysipelothrix sp.]
MSLNMILEHFIIVGVSAVFLLLIGLALGIVAYRYPRMKKYIMFVVDVFQTIPTLATLGILLVFFGATLTTVVIGLVLYSLLPVVLNTVVGLESVDPGVKEAAVGIGMSRMQRLFRVELPLAFPMIFSGMRIAVVTSIGVAIFATFVGGGGMGEILYKGVRTQNMSMIIQGTIVLIIMSFAVDGVLAFYENKLTKKRGN